MSKKRMFSLGLVVALALLIAVPVGGSEPKAEHPVIPRVEKMPDLPKPYLLRNWHQIAADYVAFAFDFDRKGPYLPLIRWQDDAHSTFFLPSYLGGNGPEAINCMAAVVSGTLVGLDMTRYRQHDWVKMCQAYFSPQDGVYTNNLHGRVSGSAWYDVFPNILFYQLADRYPDAGDTRAQFQSIAEQWRRACVVMGGKAEPCTLPDFDHTGFRFETMTPLNNGQWTEPDMAAGIAWLEYMAYTRSKGSRYLTAADWCLRALEQRPVEKNPLYEVLLPYGALVAARMNAAEEGRDYDVHKLLNWCFEAGDQRSARIGWGVITDRFGDYDCHGLVGSVTDTDGYAFAMNTFEWAGALTPLVRYDARYARTIGKWMVNLTSAARLFYPASLPAAQQDDRAWADANDPAGCLAYEGLRHQALRFTSDVVDDARPAGPVKSGSDAAIHKLDNVTEDLATAPDAQGMERLEHLWKVSIPDAGEHHVEIFARCLAEADAPHGFWFLWSRERNGVYAPLFEVKETDRITWHSAPLPNLQRGAMVYVKAIALDGGRHETLQVDQIRVRSLDAANAPYATGDALGWGGPSNLCLYGGSHVGLLGALVTKTSDDRIPGFDLLATDWFHAPAFQSRLFYNPYNQVRRITFPIGAQAVDVYDAVTHRFLVRHAVKTIALTLPPEDAVVAVFVPSGGHVVRQRNRLMVNGVIVDYRVGPAQQPQVQAAGDWQIGPFVKQDRVNPVLAPNAGSLMYCPMRGGKIRWQEKLVYNPAAVVRNGKVYLLYRAEGSVRGSRIGLASSADGLHFTALPRPVLSPANDAMKPYEWPGGCEDPRVVEDAAGNYLMYYTAYNGKVPRLAVARSRDLVNWKKLGIAFNDPPFRDEATKSAAVVCRRVGERFVATKIDGRYWMYLRDSRLLAATSDDLIHWQVVTDGAGKPLVVFGARPGMFDSELAEPGPQALLNDDGILLLYNGVNAKRDNDPTLPAGAFSGGQILFAAHDPTRILNRSSHSFIRPDRRIEREGLVPNVCFLEGLVRFKGAWYLYYGAADTRIGVAVSTAAPRP